MSPAAEFWIALALACISGAGAVGFGFWTAAAWDRWKDEYAEKTGKISGRILDPGKLIEVSFSTNIKDFSWEELEKGIDLSKQSPLGGNLNFSVPVRLHVENDNLLIDAEMKSKDKTVFTIVGNDFTFNPDGQFDRNLGLHAFEVVDRNRIPVFQLHLRRPNKIFVGGWLERDDGLVTVFTTRGVFDGYTKEEGRDLVRPFFKYPSSSFLGVSIPENEPVF